MATRRDLLKQAADVGELLGQMAESIDVDTFEQITSQAFVLGHISVIVSALHGLKNAVQTVR